MITLKVTTLTPLSIVQRDPSGRPCIPATALKGRLRAEVERLAVTFGMSVCQPPRRESMCRSTNPCVVCQLMGSPALEGRLFFEDLVAAEMIARTTRQSGARSRTRGVFIGTEARQTETLAAPAEFEGHIRHGLRESWQIALACMGLQAISSFGGGYSVGWGACTIQLAAYDLAGNRLQASALAEAFRARTAYL